TTESTSSQPIQSISSETIIDIDSTSTPLESDNLNTETSQTSIEVAVTTPLPNTSFFSISTLTESSKITIEFGGEVHNISTFTIEFEQEQTTTFYSVPPSSIQILDSRSAPVSPIIPPTPFKISSTPPNTSLLTSTADHWSSVAVNRNIEQSSSSSYTPLYPQLDTSNNFSSKFSSIPISTQYIAPLSPLVLPTTYHTTDYNIGTLYQANIEQSSLYPRIDKAIWNTFYPDNYNTKTQYTSIYPNISNTEETTQTPLNNQSDSDSKQSFGKAFTAILNQVRTLNNNTNNQDLSSNHSTSDEESNSSD
ncbi:29654_t:CDS:1, partial [Gigaspora margarita]